MNAVFRSIVLLLAVCASWTCLAQQARKIMPMDRLKLACQEEGLLSKTYKVNKDGVILIDFLGAVPVSGMTEKEAADEISKRLVQDRILKSATVSVEVEGQIPQTPPAEPPKTPAPVTIGGAVKTTDPVAYKAGLRLSDVLAAAGPTEQADLTKVQIKSADGAVRTVDASKPEPLELVAGDSVTVGTKPTEPDQPRQVSVMGGVVNPGAVEFRTGVTLRTAIQAAGGFATDADKTKVAIERTGGAPQLYDLSAAGDDPVLAPNDRIVVPVAESRSYVMVSGAVRNPGYLVVKPGMKLAQAIESAGGLLPGAVSNKIKISNGTEKPRTVNYDDIAQGLSGDVVLRAGDQVTVGGRDSRMKVSTKVVAGVAAAWLLFGR